MFIKLKNLVFLLSLIYLCSCSANKDDQDINSTNEFPEIEYINAKKLLDDKEYLEAKKSFNSIEKKYPLSNWALKSKIMSIFIDYLMMDYESADIDIKRFINRYPDYKDVDYAYYLQSLISYEQIKNPSLDATYTKQALENFNELIRRFPNSQYSKDGKQKIILINSILAGKDMHIGFYYLEHKKYLSALNRYRKVIDDYEPNRYTPEALHRIVEIYYLLGMTEDAEKIAAILGHNYPESEWYERTYKIVGKKELNEDKDGSWSGKLLKKIF